MLWPNASSDGKLIVFERNFGIWTLTTENGLTQPVRIQQRGAPASPGVPLAGTGALTRWQESGLPRAWRGVRRLGRRWRRCDLTTTTAAETGLAWAPASRRLVYASARNGANHLYGYTFATGQEARLTNAAVSDAEPRFSPVSRSGTSPKLSAATWGWRWSASRRRRSPRGSAGLPASPCWTCGPPASRRSRRWAGSPRTLACSPTPDPGSYFAQ